MGHCLRRRPRHGVTGVGEGRVKQTPPVRHQGKQHSIVKFLARKFVHIHTEAYRHHFEVKRENIEDSTIHTEEKATLTQKEKRNVQKY